jgi:HD-GYP domain-containing protein (c-di-GMP phosphodiesterase class II)
MRRSPHAVVRYDPPVSDSGVRLSDLLVAMSLATDLGFGQPTEHMLRSARIGMRLGERLGLDPGQMATLYDVGLLTYVGCPTYGNEAAKVFGDDIDFRAHALEVDLAGFPAMLFMLRRAGSGRSAFNRALEVAGFMASGGRAVVEQMASHCSAAGALADRLGLGPDVRAGIEQAYARWDGRGVPDTLSGNGLSLAARISHVAEACEVFERTAGVDVAVDMVRSRSGTHFDPDIARVAATDPGSLFDGISENTVDEIVAAEPVERANLSDDDLDAALEAIGDFCDLRCSFFAGHARGTATLTAAAAELLRMPATEVRLTYRAALVHDIGRFGVDASVWAQPGPLSATQRERMRMHVYLVERILDRPQPLRRIGLLAATHHERMDGSGYHRGVGAAMLSAPARLLAAADVYHAMLQPRPYREALSGVDARRRLQVEAAQGRLDAVSVDAVLTAAGHRTNRVHTEGPMGLTTRETEVLGLLAQGLPNKSVAKRLGISPKTVSNHLERVYTKLGVTNRAGATMAAMQYGLVGTAAEN